METFVECKLEDLLKIFSLEKSKLIAGAWMSSFGKNKLGLNLKAYKWHVFSGGGYPAASGTQAESMYAEHEVESYIVMPNGSGLAFLTSKKPKGLNSIDCYIFPENMAWTMAFTHEEGWLGPYFAEHRDYLLLESQNKARMKKLLQINKAKDKGWA